MFQCFATVSQRVGIARWMFERKVKTVRFQQRPSDFKRSDNKFADKPGNLSIFNIIKVRFTN